MTEQRKNISSIILHKDEPLCRVLAMKKGEGQDQPSKDVIIETLLNVDNIVANLEPYDKNMLSDINRGHWDIYRNCESTENTIEFKLPKGETLVACSPLLSVNKNGVVAIDFGTKSTVAGLIDSYNNKELIRIGHGNYKKDQSKNDYENPTVVEFRDIEQFFKDYHSVKSRPLTSWDDVCISHAAARNLAESDNENFYRFFSNLKQWARTKGKKLRIKDLKTQFTLKDFIDCDSKSDINPIEIYAYYIGRYINNMTRGIYLNYLLSYPVKYEASVKEKIRESFEKGLRKAIPYAVLCSGDYELKVELATSEPSAYAISALKEYGFNEIDKTICYGIFDFGGGTTDFDFGMWKAIDSRKYDYEIKHFGAGGDPTLGGENLLKLLAFEVFKDNKDTMREKNCSFTKPERISNFGGFEGLVNNSREAMKNTIILAEFLRPFWENVGHIEEGTDISQIQNIMSGSIKIQLIDNDSNAIAVDLQVSDEKLKNILKTEISRGVKNFFSELAQASDKMLLEKDDKIHIFLGGNASRSILVTQCFEEEINNLGKEKNLTFDNHFELYPALGTSEAREKMESKGIMPKNDDDLSKAVTCKTGVVFGLLDSRKGGKIKVESEIGATDEAKFEFHLGYEKHGKFKIAIEKNDTKFNDGDWCEFCDYADVEELEIHYTSEARAESNDMDIANTRKTIIKLDKSYGENDIIRLHKTSVNSFTYEVFSKEGKMLSNMQKVINL